MAWWWTSWVRSICCALKAQVEAQLGVELTTAASAYPPGVPLAEVRATANVLYAAGLECTGLVDEPTAANNVLQIRNGAIVDVGGGTTGIAVVEDGQVVYTADEPTGGTHFTLVVAGAKNLPFEQAEALKVDPQRSSCSSFRWCARSWRKSARLSSATSPAAAWRRSTWWAAPARSRHGSCHRGGHGRADLPAGEPVVHHTAGDCAGAEANVG